MGFGGSGAHGARGACRWPARQPCVGAYLTLHPTPPRLGSFPSPLAWGVTRSPRKPGSSVALRTALRLVAAGAPLSQAAFDSPAASRLAHPFGAAYRQSMSAPASRFHSGPRSARPPPPAAGRPSLRMLRTAAAGIVRRPPRPLASSVAASTSCSHWPQSPPPPYHACPPRPPPRGKSAHREPLSCWQSVLARAAASGAVASSGTFSTSDLYYPFGLCGMPPFGRVLEALRAWQST